MAAYSYKDVVYRDDFQELIPEFEKQFRRECDQNSNYDGDHWLIADMLLEKKDETIRTQQATIDRLTSQRDRLLDDLKDLESATRHFHPCQATMEKCTALIAEIEAKK